MRGVACGALVIALSGAALVLCAPAFAERPDGWEEPPDCAVPTISGTPGDDTLTGTPGDDVIAGYAGDDMIDGMGGLDTICGGSGADTITNQGCRSDIAAGYGPDKVTLGRGCPGTPSYVGDSVWDGPGDDRVETDRGGDVIFGGPGDDRVFTARNNDHVYDGPGSDVYRSGIRPDALHFFRPGGFDRYFAGLGRRDQVLFVDYPHPISVNLGTKTWSAQGKRGRITGIYLLHGTAFGDRIVGSSRKNIAYAGAGDDYLAGKGRRDSLDGEQGRDRIHGGPARDGVHGGAGKDTGFGGPGDDYVYGGRGPDYVYGGPGVDEVQGNRGFDHCFGGEEIWACERKN